MNLHFECRFLYLFQIEKFLGEPVRLGPNQYACPYCSKIMKKSHKVRRHIKIHTGEKPFQCPYCVYRCIQKNNLKIHCIKQHGMHNIDL